MDVMKQVALLKLKHKKVGRRRLSIPFPDLTEERAPVLSNALPERGGFRRDALVHRWRRGAEEKPETIREIEAKKTRIAPLFNKGAYGYLTPETDAKTIGRK